MTVRVRSWGWLLGPVSLLLVTALLAASAGASDPVPGSQGTDTSLPPTASQATMKGRGKFADLSITVNQTANLTDQAVSITWTGGKPTLSGPGRFGSQFLQIFQCWGDDNGQVPDNPGPPPEQCEQGAVAGSYGGIPGSLYPGGFALSRIISRSNDPNYTNYDPNVGVTDPRTTNVWLPFRAVDGTVVNIQTDPTFNPAIVGGNFWLNPYYNQITTNEIAGAATDPDGKGAELLQVVTGVESSGLGCGQKTQPVPGGGTKIPQCWIVIVPRGTPFDENQGTPFGQTETLANQVGVATSPISPSVWPNRIAIPISFNPVDSPCVLGSDERQISGSELALPAVGSWQPSLCSTASLPPYSYATVSDSSARQQLVSGQYGAPGLVVVSKPIDPTTLDPANPVVYAPLTLSGLVIGFNIERNPTPDAVKAEQLLSGVRIAQLNLTPRLVAKLLTQSYKQAVSIIQVPNYPWMPTNPAHMGIDPDFLQFNPEFALLQVADGRSFSGLSLPQGNSDAAEALWNWIFADPEAAAWMAGAPDPWGMKVNPVYATKADANPTGLAFGSPTPTSFPKSDPYCYQAAPRPGSQAGTTIVPPPLCGTDWMPYKGGLAATAKVARTAFDGAKIAENPFALTASDVWKVEGPQYLGRRDILSVTDTPSAAQFGIQTAKLSRAGDDGSDRMFVAADAGGLLAGVSTMTASVVPSVLQPAPSALAPGAYPLTNLTYAAVAPLSLDAKARSDFGAFIDYAVGPGQVPGLAPGQLPRGYAPLPASLKAQATAAAAQVRTLNAPVDATTTTTTAPTTTAVTTTTAAVTTTAAATTTTVSTTTSAAASTTSAVSSSPPVAVPVSTQSTPNQSPSASVPFTAPPSATPATIPVVSAPTSDLPTTAPPATTAELPAATEPPSTAATPVDQADGPATTTPTVITPFVNLARNRYAVPGLGVVALGSALGALEITKRPRRGAVPEPEDGEALLDGAAPHDGAVPDESDFPV